MFCYTHRRNFRGNEGARTPTFLELEDGPPLYKYTKSEILLGSYYFSEQSYATGYTVLVVYIAAYSVNYPMLNFIHCWRGDDSKSTLTIVARLARHIRV